MKRSALRLLKVKLQTPGEESTQQKQGNLVFTHMTRSTGSHSTEMHLKTQDPKLLQTVQINLKLTEADDMRNVLNVMAC
jgi:hypothetical protein